MNASLERVVFVGRTRSSSGHARCEEKRKRAKIMKQPSDGLHEKQKPAIMGCKIILETWIQQRSYQFVNYLNNQQMTVRQDNVISITLHLIAVFLTRFVSFQSTSYSVSSRDWVGPVSNLNLNINLPAILLCHRF